MKKLFILINIAQTLSLPAQRYTGYGRGSDWGSSSSGSVDCSLLIIGIVIIIIGGLYTLIIKIRETKGLSSGKYIKIIRNGYMVTVPSKDIQSHPFQVIETWNFDDFKKSYDSIQFKKYRINVSKENLDCIICTKGESTITIFVRFECSTENIGCIISEYKVALIKGGTYLLFKK